MNKKFECIYDEHVSCLSIIKCNNCGTVVFYRYDEDYEPFHTDSNGALWVHPTDTIAHDAADAGNPIKIGFKSVNFNGSAPPNAAAAEKVQNRGASRRANRPNIYGK